MKKMKKIAVLLSSYNGEKFLREQIDSIARQKKVDVHLFIRDDGSTDKTIEILQAYQEKYNFVTVNLSDNVGWRKSFFSLLASAETENFEYFALADQDDVWHEMKLFTAIEMLEKNNGTLYYSNLELMDDNFNSMGLKIEPSYQLPNSGVSGFFDNQATGSTFVITANFLKIIQNNLDLENIYENAHDAFLFSASNFIGKTIYDKNSLIKYRRHFGTATGFGVHGNQIKPSLKDRYLRYKKMPSKVYTNRAKLLIRTIGNHLENDDLIFLKSVENSSVLSNRIKLIFRNDVRAKGLFGFLKIKFRLVKNRF